ncbi:MAG: MFS transporter [Gammaproteobacteria bacterium]|nr:MFS transporter [Gammaproteobacteria bacterium]NND54118.1 MFS transporter [Gammaproteobacteria bacterium]
MSRAATTQRKVFYGWWLAAVCVLVYFFTNGMTIFVPQNLFPRLMEEFAIDAGEVSRTVMVTFLGTALLAPIAGWLIDRFGVLRVIHTGLVFLAVCFGLYPFATSITQLYVLHFGFAVGLVLCGLMPNVVLLSAWFTRYRGAVVGLLTAASSLAGGLLPLAIAPLVLNPDFGWRWGFGALAIAFVVLGLIPGLLALRSSPADVGQYPDGDAEPLAALENGAVDGVEFGVALRSRTLWALAVSSACLWYAITSINSQAQIFFEQDAGLTAGNATLLYSAIFWCSVAGKFLFGALSDRIPKQRVMLISAVLLFIGSLLAFTPGDNGFGLTTNFTQLVLFATVFGLGYGGSFTMIQLVCVECFGQRALGKLLGIVIFVDSLGGALGTALSGQLKASTGSYLTSFTTVSVVALIAIMGVLLIKPLQPSKT